MIPETAEDAGCVQAWVRVRAGVRVEVLRWVKSVI
jgi:hypothetical protein